MHRLLVCARQTLCRTLNDNKVEVLTVSSHVRHLTKETLDQVTTRPYIFLSARVHPGESNASWLMKVDDDMFVKVRKS